MKLFFDTSAFAKRFIEEEGSEKVVILYNAAHEIVLSSLAVVELVSALNRLKREHKITLSNYDEIKLAIFHEVEALTIYSIDQNIIEISIKLLEQYALKTLDALHLATAIISDAQQFISADQQQLKAAKAIGLNVLIV